jgi:hypothetical protein
MQEGIFKRARCHEGECVASIVTGDGFEQGIS